MKLEILPISEIHPYENNSRVHPQEQLEKLAASIRAFGIAKPILLDEKHMILAGHGIYEAAQIAEKTEIPCVINDTLTEEQKRAYIITKRQPTRARVRPIRYGKGVYSRYTAKPRNTRTLRIRPATEQAQDCAAGTAATASIRSGRVYRCLHTRRKCSTATTRRSSHTAAKK